MTNHLYICNLGLARGNWYISFISENWRFIVQGFNMHTLTLSRAFCFKNCLYDYVSPSIHANMEAFGSVWQTHDRRNGDRSGFSPCYMMHELLTFGYLKNSTVKFYLDCWDITHQELSNDTHDKYILSKVFSSYPCFRHWKRYCCVRCLQHKDVTYFRVTNR